jgi:hypothetical protein
MRLALTRAQHGRASRGRSAPPLRTLGGMHDAHPGQRPHCRETQACAIVVFFRAKLNHRIWQERELRNTRQ